MQWSLTQTNLSVSSCCLWMRNFFLHYLPSLFLSLSLPPNDSVSLISISSCTTLHFQCNSARPLQSVSWRPSSFFFTRPPEQTSHPFSLLQTIKKKIHIELEKIALTSHSLLGIKYLHWHHVIYKKEVNSCWILIECTKTCHFKRRGFTFYIQCVCMSVLLLLEYSSPPPVWHPICLGMLMHIDLWLFSAWSFTGAFHEEWWQIRCQWCRKDFNLKSS